MPPINSVDATTGQPMVMRVHARKAELEARLVTLPEDDLQTRSDIKLALATISELLTGDLAQIPPVVAADMNRWLERNKHIAEVASGEDPAPQVEAEESEAQPLDGDSGMHVTRATD